MTLQNPLLVGTSFDSKQVDTTIESQQTDDNINTVISVPTDTKEIVKQRWTWVWTEDGIGMVLAIVIFIMVLIISQLGKSLAAYSASSAWPFGGILIGFITTAIAHYCLGKSFPYESYCVVLLLAVLSRSIGNYEALASNGLTASLWSILFGICLRYGGLVLSKDMFSGEFFVKIGVTLLAMVISCISSLKMSNI